MKRKVCVLQNEDREILAVEGSLKKLLKKDGHQDKLPKYWRLHRLSKKAKDDDKESFTFDGSDGERYQISFWYI